MPTEAICVAKLVRYEDLCGFAQQKIPGFRNEGPV